MWHLLVLCYPVLVQLCNVREELKKRKIKMPRLCRKSTLKARLRLALSQEEEEVRLPWCSPSPCYAKVMYFACVCVRARACVCVCVCGCVCVAVAVAVSVGPGRTHAPRSCSVEAVEDGQDTEDEGCKPRARAGEGTVQRVVTPWRGGNTVYLHAPTVTTTPRSWSWLRHSMPVAKSMCLAVVATSACGQHQYHHRTLGPVAHHTR